MTMTPFFRKLALTAHVTFSVGWLGAVAGFLALAITGLTSKDEQMVRSTYISMELIAWFVIVPANFCSLLTGIILALGTKWGLFKHYWVLVKLILTVVSTILLLLHMQPISYLSDMASKINFLSSDFREMRTHVTTSAEAALVVLLVSIILSIYKPWGKTGYGIRIERQNEVAILANTNKSVGKYVIYGIIGLFILAVIIHLMGGGLGGH